MTFKELLKAHGLADERVSVIMGAMKENRLYISNEENIDIRYRKLKAKVETAEKTIANLKRSSKDHEALQEIIEVYKNKIATMKKEHDDKMKDMIIKLTIKNKLSGAKYPDLIEDQFDLEKITVSKDGKEVFGIDEQLTWIKEQYKDLFISKRTMEKSRVQIPCLMLIQEID